MTRGTIAAILSVLGTLSAIARGAVIHVAPDQTIQGAIVAAGPGDVIVVAPGLYAERIDLLGKAITLRSSAPGEATVVAATVIHAGGSGSAVTCRTGEGSATVIDGFTITGGAGTPMGPDRLGGGMLILASDPTVSRCVFTANTADTGGGMMNMGGSPTVYRCVFEGNTAAMGGMGGGAGMANGGGSPTVSHCSFLENTTPSWGGGMNNVGSSPLVVNTVFARNEAAGGGAIRNSLSDPIISNCTIYGNTAGAGAGGGGVRSSSNGTPLEILVRNCVLWGNGDAGIVDSAGAVTVVASSDVEGGWPGAGNVDADPRFVDPASSNFRLSPGSPCIVSGDNAAVPPGIVTDLDGNARIVNGTVDMGAYESQVIAESCPSDIDGDGTTALGDLLALLAAWGPCETDPPRIACAADVDGDGAVGLTDLVAVLYAWGRCSDGG